MCSSQVLVGPGATRAVWRRPVKGRTHEVSGGATGSSHFCSNLSLLAQGRQVSESLSFLLHLRQPWHYIQRKGWTALETPNRWFQLIRGPRPPSVRWEKSRQARGPWLWQRGSPHRSRVDLEVAMENAQSKVARFEAVGDLGGVVVESLQAEWVKAQAAAVLPPIDVQISNCKEFIERSERRLVCLEAETVIEKEALSEWRARLARMEEEQRSRQPRAPPPQTEVRVEQLMEEISQLRQERDRLARLVVAESEGHPDPKRVCRREDFVPMCDEKMHEWLEARQRDLHTARVSGQHSEVERLSKLMAQATQEWQHQQTASLPSTHAHMVR